MHRIQFLSINDGTVAYYLLKLEDRFSELDMIEKLDINDFLELYNAKLYIDNNLFLIKWDNDKIKKLKDKTEENWKKIKHFFLQIDSESFQHLFEQVDFKYKNHFWKIVDQLEVYKKINEETIQAILTSHLNEIRNILEHEKLVKRFSSVVRNYLLSKQDSAELILSDEDRFERKNKLYFPKSLSIYDKETIINNYLDQDSPNLNYVSLALYAKNSAFLKLTDKTRLKAKRTYDRLSEEFLNSDKSATQIYGIEIGTVDKQEKLIISRWEENTYKVTYDVDGFMSILEKSNLKLLFEDLFQFIDQEGLIRLVSKESESSIMEKIFMQSRNEYGTGLLFSRKDMLSLGQLKLAINLLENNSKDVSLLIDKHVTELSIYNSGLKKLRFKMPRLGLSYEESIRILAPSLESVLNQYALFVNDGEIDFELLEISSKPTSFGSIKSNAIKKYYYPTSDSTITSLLHLFFSDQSMLHYVKPYDDKYDNFYELLTNERNLPYSNFENYQKNILDQLIAEGVLFLENGEFVKIVNENKLFIISQLYTNGVISYWHYPPTFRNELDELVKQGLCYTESTLFTKHEATYINFYLNKKEYTDGPDLRNKYLHGTNVSSNDSANDYYMYLRIVILCLLKLEDDLLITEECKKYNI